jgi:AcrR family transcriptional regulator
MFLGFSFLEMAGLGGAGACPKFVCRFWRKNTFDTDSYKCIIHTNVCIMSTRTTKTERTPEAPHATRDRILDVAEGVFAQRGIDGVSVRDIIGAAQANLGAINYHFGTKEKLIAAVLERRMAPMRQQRLQLLDEAEQAAGGKVPEIEAILLALFRPAVEQAMDDKRGGCKFGKLMARCFMDPHPVMEAKMRAEFALVVKRFDDALMRAMPKLTPEDVFWRMHLLMGALHHSLLMLDIKAPAGAPILKWDADTYIKRFITFAVAAFRVPPA